jgi:transposase, IS5 family
LAIAYPTDLNLLSEARQISERLIDTVYDAGFDGKKPRTYRKSARKEYLQTAQKKSPQTKTIRKAVGRQLRYLKRNLKSLDKMLDRRTVFPLGRKDQQYLMVIHTLFQQQMNMFLERTHSLPDRIVSLHQPHDRPIVRGKLNSKVEFGSKIHVFLANGFAYLDTISWDAFDESSSMMEYIEQYKRRFGYYPEKVLADQIYCTRENRRKLHELGIRLMAKPLGRPKAVADHEGQAQRHFSIMDRLDHPGAQPGQTGRGSTPVSPEFFSMEASHSWITGRNKKYPGSSMEPWVLQFLSF